MSVDQYSTKVDLLLSQYVKYYPLYKSGDSVEHDNTFHSIEGNLRSTYTDMFLLENKLTKEIETLRATVANYNAEIKENKEKLVGLRKDYAAMQNVANASGPMLEQQNEIKTEKEEQMTYYVAAALIVLYLLSRNFFTD